MATREKIAVMRKRFEDAQCPCFPLRHGDYELEYFVLPQTLCTELPNFAFQMMADDWSTSDLRDYPKQVALFGVSESVPEAMQPFVMHHEMFEYVDRLTCPQAALRELEQVAISAPRAVDVLKYLLQRLALFEPLETWAKNRPEQYPRHKVDEFCESCKLYQLLFKMLSKK